MLSRLGCDRIIKNRLCRSVQSSRLEPGSYLLRVSAAGFADQWKQDLVLVSGQNAQLETTLYPQELSATPVLVTVGDEAAIDITRTVVGGTITAHEIESLPINTRSALDLVCTAEALSRNACHQRTRRRSGATLRPRKKQEYLLRGVRPKSNNCE